MPQTNDELAADNVVASLVIDVDGEEMQLADADGNELSGMMVSLNVELESSDINLPSYDDCIDVAVSPTKAYKVSAVSSSQNCSLKHTHGCAHSHKAGMLLVCNV